MRRTNKQPPPQLNNRQVARQPPLPPQYYQQPQWQQPPVQPRNFTQQIPQSVQSPFQSFDQPEFPIDINNVNMVGQMSVEKAITLITLRLSKMEFFVQKLKLPGEGLIQSEYPDLSNFIGKISELEQKIASIESNVEYIKETYKNQQESSTTSIQTTIIDDNINSIVSSISKLEEKCNTDIEEVKTTCRKLHSLLINNIIKKMPEEPTEQEVKEPEVKEPETPNSLEIIDD